MKQGRIALLTDGIYPYVMGGMQRHSYFLAKYLAKKGIYVDLYHTPGKSTYDPSKLEFFTGVERDFIHPILIPFPDMGRLPGHYIKESFRYSAMILEELKKRPETDFIYAKGFTGWKLISEKSKGLKLPPIGVKFHGLEMFQAPASFRSRFESMLLRGPTRYCMKHADHVFSYGGKITELIRSIGVSENKIVEIPSAIESSLVQMNIGPKNDPLKFVFVGRYEPRKGLKELSKSVMSLPGSGFEMHFIGPIPHSKRIERAGVVYHGAVTESRQLLDIIRSCDVLICPSYSEGMPNVILEAMSQGLAIIATDVGAVSLLVSSENGRLLSSPDEKILANSLLEFTKMNPAGLEEMKKGSLRKIREFTWEVTIEKFISFLNAVSLRD